MKKFAALTLLFLFLLCMAQGAGAWRVERFEGELPEELASAFDGESWQGATCETGVIRVEYDKNLTPSRSAITIMGGESREAVILEQTDDGWQIVEAGAQAVPQGEITYCDEDDGFCLAVGDYGGERGDYTLWTFCRRMDGTWALDAVQGVTPGEGVFNLELDGDAWIAQGKPQEGGEWRYRFGTHGLPLRVSTVNLSDVPASWAELDAAIASGGWEEQERLAVAVGAKNYEPLLKAPGGDAAAYVADEVPVQVLREENGYALVRVGIETGYIRSDALAPIEDWFILDWCYPLYGAIPLYAAPDERSGATDCPYGTKMSILGYTGEFLHVRTKVEGIEGYVRMNVVQVPINSNPEVLNPDPKDRLNLRAEPSVNAPSLGRFYSGVTVVEAFDPHQSEHPDWTRVMIGDRVGYMLNDYLTWGSWDADRPHLPPMVTMTRAETIASEAAGEARLEAGMQVEALGITEDGARVIVRRGNVIGDVPAESVTSIQGVTGNEAELVVDAVCGSTQVERYGEPEGTLSAGTAVTVYDRNGDYSIVRVEDVADEQNSLVLVRTDALGNYKAAQRIER